MWTAETVFTIKVISMNFSWEVLYELHPTFNMFLASKASLSLVPCLPELPLSSTEKKKKKKHEKDESTRNEQNWFTMFDNGLTALFICIHLHADKQREWWHGPLAHAVLLVSPVQIWELRLDLIHGQNEWSHCHNTWKTLLGARKQSCGSTQTQLPHAYIHRFGLVIVQLSALSSRQRTAWAKR